jgi:hypothetical protein
VLGGTLAYGHLFVYLNPQNNDVYCLFNNRGRIEWSRATTWHRPGDRQTTLWRACVADVCFKQPDADAEPQVTANRLAGRIVSAFLEQHWRSWVRIE